MYFKFCFLKLIKNKTNPKQYQNTPNLNQCGIGCMLHVVLHKSRGKPRQPIRFQRNYQQAGNGVRCASRFCRDKINPITTTNGRIDYCQQMDYLQLKPIDCRVYICIRGYDFYVVFWWKMPLISEEQRLLTLIDKKNVYFSQFWEIHYSGCRYTL